MTEKDKELYSEIERLIIMWSNDGTKTAGYLTRKIMKLITKNDKMENLNITVSGKVGSGNSYLLYEIRRLLRENGWNVEHNYISEDNETEIDLDRIMVEDLEERIQRLKTNVKITINEKQLPRT